MILLAVWLHDISHYVSDQDFDHAVRSEQMAKEFLTKEKYSMRKIIEVCHCIRAHRNRDVKPETLEAKIVACIDSASHMTGEMYIQIAIAGKFNYLFEKINRDFADLTPFPEIQSQLSDLTDDWIKLIQSYRKLNLIPEQEYTK